jgi:hypothetical protein
MPSSSFSRRGLFFTLALLLLSCSVLAATLTINATDSQDSFSRYWYVFVNTYPGAYVGSGQYQSSPSYSISANSGYTLYYSGLPANGTLYFVITQSGGSAYGQYSGHVQVGSESTSYSGVDANHALKVVYNYSNLVSVSTVSLSGATTSTTISTTATTSTFTTTTVSARPYISITPNRIQLAQGQAGSVYAYTSGGIGGYSGHGLQIAGINGTVTYLSSTGGIYTWLLNLSISNTLTPGTYILQPYSWNSTNSYAYSNLTIVVTKGSAITTTIPPATVYVNRVNIKYVNLTSGTSFTTSQVFNQSSTTSQLKSWTMGAFANTAITNFTVAWPFTIWNASYGRYSATMNYVNPSFAYTGPINFTVYYKYGQNSTTTTTSMTSTTVSTTTVPQTPSISLSSSLLYLNQGTTGYVYVYTNTGNLGGYGYGVPAYGINTLVSTVTSPVAYTTWLLNVSASSAVAPGTYNLQLHTTNVYGGSTYAYANLTIVVQGSGQHLTNSTRFLIYTYDNQDPYSRYFETFVNRFPGRYYGSGSYSNSSTYSQVGLSSGSVVNASIPMPSGYNNTIYFVPTQSGGSAYGTYSVVFGVKVGSNPPATYSAYGLDAFHALKVVLFGNSVVSYSVVALPNSTPVSAAPNVSVTPNPVPAGQNVTITGTGSAASDIIDILLSGGFGAYSFNNGIVAGMWSGNSITYNLQAGNYTILAWDTTRNPHTPSGPSVLLRVTPPAATTACNATATLQQGQSLICGRLRVTLNGFTATSGSVTSGPISVSLYMNNSLLGTYNTTPSFYLGPFSTIGQHYYVYVGQTFINKIPAGFYYPFVPVEVIVNSGSAISTITLSTSTATTSTVTTTVPTTFPTTTISKVNYATYTLVLKPGWNMFSIPLQYATRVNATCSSSDLLSPVWQLSGGQYVKASYLYGGYGYWLDAGRLCAITFYGPALSASQFPNLTSGWNLVGALNYSTPISSIIGSCSVAKGPTGFNTTSGSYYNTSILTPGNGYFINVKSACSLGSSAPPAPPS